MIKLTKFNVLQNSKCRPFGVVHQTVVTRQNIKICFSNYTKAIPKMMHPLEKQCKASASLKKFLNH